MAADICTNITANISLNTACNVSINIALDAALNISLYVTPHVGVNLQDPQLSIDKSKCDKLINFFDFRHYLQWNQIPV